MITGDVTLVRLYQPATGRSLFNIQNHCVAVNRRTTCPRALGERLGQVGRLDVAIIRMVDATYDAIDFAHWP